MNLTKKSLLSGSLPVEARDHIKNVLVYGCFRLAISTLRDSENGRFAETEIRFPIKHEILQNSKFEIRSGDD